eukprot:TRINITY_DN1624_c0_g1_i2.p1 TRINITY_DN1624_c0_g1~~TRINITY_DN1624_c0_g1_i2.p1  ORF type:complete len:310 (+),score=85.09 TRINITY_DN1624_c0_g1_i2:157-1086(+)
MGSHGSKPASSVTPPTDAEAVDRPSEKEIFDSVALVMVKGSDILNRLETYDDCEELIVKAKASPGPENDAAAWQAVLPAVKELKAFHDFALELEVVFPNLLVALCSDGPNATIANQQALAKQLADVFNFVLQFDELKMMNSAIGNDFSHYRRSLLHGGMVDVDSIVSDGDTRNRMSLFFAYPTPMMNLLHETTTKLLTEDASMARDNVTCALATMANTFQEMVEQRRFDSEEKNMFCLRSMTGSIILFDHIHSHGAFSRTSPVLIKGCITALRGFRTPEKTENLLNALRFTTVHLNDPDTPSNIKHLLD